MSSTLLPKAVIGVDVAEARRDPDAALIALRPLWLAGLAAYHAALDDHGTIEGRIMARHPGRGALDAASPATVLRGGIGADDAAFYAEANLRRAECMKRETEDADAAMVDRIAATPALTLVGIMFKVDVSRIWSHDHPDLVVSIMDDIEILVSRGGAPCP